MDEDCLKRLKWINIRTLANFDLPCAKCGSTVKVEMHHVKQVKKEKYTLIPKVDTLKRMMSLRNRKQVPVCRFCHNLIHSKNNKNERVNFPNPIIPLFEVGPNGKPLFDNRILDSERFIHKRDIYLSLPFVDNLKNKGWREVK